MALLGYSALCPFARVDMFACLQDAEVALKGHFDAVLDTIGVPDTERMGISLLKKGGHYMTLQVRSCLTFVTVNLLLFFLINAKKFAVRS